MRPHPIRSAITTSVLVSLLALTVVGLYACGTPKPPGGPAGIVGQIQSVNTSGADTSILVVGGKQAAGAVSDKAMCRVTAKTTIVDSAGSKIDRDRLTLGSTVAVWFTGAVAESYPVQGTAAYIQVRSSGK